MKRLFAATFLAGQSMTDVDLPPWTGRDRGCPAEINLEALSIHMMGQLNANPFIKVWLGDIACAPTFITAYAVSKDKHDMFYSILGYEGGIYMRDLPRKIQARLSTSDHQGVIVYFSAKDPEGDRFN